MSVQHGWRIAAVWWRWGTACCSVMFCRPPNLLCLLCLLCLPAVEGGTCYPITGIKHPHVPPTYMCLPRPLPHPNACHACSQGGHILSHHREEAPAAAGGGAALPPALRVPGGFRWVGGCYRCTAQCYAIALCKCCQYWLRVPPCLCLHPSPLDDWCPAGVFPLTARPSPCLPHRGRQPAAAG